MQTNLVETKTCIITILLRTASSIFGNGANALLTDWDKTLMAAGGLSLLALGIYSAKGFTSVTAKYVESRLGEYTYYITLTKLMSKINLYFLKFVNSLHISSNIDLI